jgi:three-Cys-motif partner protein
MPSRRPRVEDTFFDELKVWSEIKLRIVENYLSAYMNKRGSSQPNIHYIDGFAGAGYYGDEREDRKEGSPIRVARLAQRIIDTGKPNRLSCQFTELDEVKYISLQRALSQFDPEIVKVHHGPFEKLLPAILRQIGRAPAIFFLDPFGVKQIAMGDLGPILRRPDTELLLNLNTRRLRMLAGFEDSDSRDAKAKMALVSRVLGEDPDNQTPEWLAEWHRLGKNGRRWEAWAVQTYIQRLGDNSSHFQYGLNYPIRERYDAPPKYHLVFATRSAHAIPIMNDFVCTEDEGLFDAYLAQRGGFQLGLFGEAVAHQPDTTVSALLDEIHMYGLCRQGCSRNDVINHFALERFGQFKKKHYRQAIDQLEATGRATFGEGTRDTAPITFVGGD